MDNVRAPDVVTLLDRPALRRRVDELGAGVVAAGLDRTSFSSSIEYWPRSTVTWGPCRCLPLSSTNIKANDLKGSRERSLSVNSFSPYSACGLTATGRRASGGGGGGAWACAPRCEAAGGGAASGAPGVLVPHAARSSKLGPMRRRAFIWLLRAAGEAWVGRLERLAHRAPPGAWA